GALHDPRRRGPHARSGGAPREDHEGHLRTTSVGAIPARRTDRADGRFVRPTLPFQSSGRTSGSRVEAPATLGSGASKPPLGAPTGSLRAGPHARLPKNR